MFLFEYLVSQLPPIALLAKCLLTMWTVIPPLAECHIWRDVSSHQAVMVYKIRQKGIGWGLTAAFTLALSMFLFGSLRSGPLQTASVAECPGPI